MNVTIRLLEQEDIITPLFTLNQYAFHSGPPYEGKEEWANLIRDRKSITCLAAFEDEQPVAIAVSTAMTQNIRGKLFPASGIWGVSTHPSARRKGYCKKVMRSLLEAEHKTGKVFSNLYPFRESFYERQGYVSYPLTKIARFDPASLEAVLSMDHEGKIEQRLIGEAFDDYREYLFKIRMTKHGMAIFDYGSQVMANRNWYWTALARFEEKIEGLMLYHLFGEEVGKFKFGIDRFYYQTPRARYLMLDWVARHIDQVNQVEIRLAEDEYPESWLVDFQVKVESAARTPMNRVLDVERIGEMTVGEGNFTTQVSDPFCPWNEGIWRFESSMGKLQVARSAHAECELTIQGLTALVNGTHDPQEIPLRGWGKSSIEIQSIQRTMFPRMRPFMHEMF
jgi:predicted acetyltransferase